MLPFWFSAMTMKSVGKAALAMVEEVRRQFNTIPGIMEGTTRPDYKRCVEISTKVGIYRGGWAAAPGACGGLLHALRSTQLSLHCCPWGPPCSYRFLSGAVACTPPRTPRLCCSRALGSICIAAPAGLTV